MEGYVMGEHRISGASQGQRIAQLGKENLLLATFCACLMGRLLQNGDAGGEIVLTPEEMSLANPQGRLHAEASLGGSIRLKLLPEVMEESKIILPGAQNVV
jgi:hypothetical protein